MPSILHKSKPVPVTGTINSHFKEKERELIEEEYTRIGLERSTWDLYDVIARSKINNPHSTEPVLCPSELDMLERSEQLACGNGKSGGDEVAALGVVDEESGSVFSMEEEEEYHGPQLLGKSASASIVSDEDLMDKALKRAKMISGRDANGEWF